MTPMAYVVHRRAVSLLSVVFLAALALLSTGCEKYLSADQGKRSMEDLPKKPAEAIEEEVGDGEIIAIRQRNYFGRDRWQVEYRDTEGNLKTFAVDEAGGEVEWVGDEPVELEDVPERPRETINEEVEDGTITDIRRTGIAGKDVWKVTYNTADGKRKTFQVDERGKIIDN